METEGHDYWEILHTGLTYNQALRFERSEAEARSCHQGDGGPRDDSDDWVVYLVSGGTIKKAT